LRAVIEPKSTCNDNSKFFTELLKTTRLMFITRDRMRSLIAEHAELIKSIEDDEPKMKRAMNTIERFIESTSVILDGDKNGEENKEEGNED